MTDPIVTPDWLAQNLDRVKVLDATYYLPADPDRIRRDYDAAHIPGAALFEIDAVCDGNSDLPHMLPDEGTFARAMAALGIDGRVPVVVYDRSANHFSSPRVWYTLRLFGLHHSYVLDGGLPAWIAAGYPVSSGASTVTPVAEVDWTLDRARVLTGADMAAFVAAGGETIFDARSRERFEGRAPEPRPGLSSGHMAGASCVPFTELTDADGRFAGVDALRAMFAAAQGRSPIVTCGSGMTACVLALGLDRIGIGARLYDGSWADWGRGQLGAIHTGDGTARPGG